MVECLFDSHLKSTAIIFPVCLAIYSSRKLRVDKVGGFPFCPVINFFIHKLR